MREGGGWVIVTHIAGCTERTWPPRFLSSLSNGGCISAVATAYRSQGLASIKPTVMNCFRASDRPIVTKNLQPYLFYIRSLARSAREASEVVNWWPPNKLYFNRESFMSFFFCLDVWYSFFIILFFFCGCYFSNVPHVCLSNVSINSSVIEGRIRGRG